MEQTCKTCRFFNFNSGAYVGECRRNAPLKDPYNHFGRSWPCTKEDDWCGEYAWNGEVELTRKVTT